MYLMARAAKRAGAKCIRTNSVRDVREIKAETGLPVILPRTLVVRVLGELLD